MYLFLICCNFWLLNLAHIRFFNQNTLTFWCFAVGYQVLIISTIYDCYIDLTVISILAATQQGAIVNQY